MKKVFCVIFFLVCCLILPLHAQWYKKAPRRPIKKAKVQLARLQRAIQSPARVTSRQLREAIQRSGFNRSLPLPGQAHKAIIPLKERHYLMRFLKTPGTAFAIEEIYNGKKYTWGVTATHYGYRRPAVAKNRFSCAPFSFVAQGNKHTNDVSIFPIPEQIASKLSALKLAPQSPAIGEELFSLSFFDNQFQYTPNRKVLEKTSQRMVTSLDADPIIDREGECGSPLINEKGEVVGMIVGASYRRNLGFAVPVENIHQILQAYHQQGKLFTPVLINGQEILKLNITEAITRIAVKNLDGFITEIPTYQQGKEIDYAHLETLMFLSNAKEVILTIQQAPFSKGQDASATCKWEVIYDLQTQQLTTNPLK